MTPPSSPAPGRPVYVPAAPFDVFGMLFQPPPGGQRRQPILVCGPYGWDDISAYRPLRLWAQHLADRGHDVLRIDLPGTGDSAGDAYADDLVGAWSAGIGAAAAWLAARTGSDAVTVLGVGVSGVVAAAAVPDAPGIGDLILWGVPARGRAVVRQLQAFAMLERESEAIDATGERIPDTAPADGRVAPGGYLLTDATQAGLRAIDLTTLPTTPFAGRRVLLLERDGLPADQRLKAHLEEADADVTVAAGDGYGPMTEHPQHSLPPEDAMRTVDAWLDEGGAGSAGGEGDAADHSGAGGARGAGGAAGDARASGASGEGGPAVVGDAAAGDVPSMQLDGVRESPFTPPAGGPAVFGIVAEPTDAPVGEVTAVFLNPGAQRRIGPNRMWVTAARRWAAAGIPSVRLDVGSLGDAPGPLARTPDPLALHDPHVVDQVVATLDVLQQRGLPARFVLVGLCAGAWIAFTVAQRDQRVRAAVLLNPRALVWSPLLSDERDARVGKRIVRRSQWARVLRGEIDRERIVRIVTAIARYPVGALRRRSRRRHVGAALARLDDAGVHVSLVFTGHEPLREELARDGHLDVVAARPNLSLIDIVGRDHTLRPLGEQDRANAVLDAELARAAGHPIDPAASR